MGREREVKVGPVRASRHTVRGGRVQASVHLKMLQRGVLISEGVMYRLQSWDLKMCPY